jgi:radical SAM protein with 4Fe4S-binding SPASM domain
MSNENHDNIDNMYPSLFSFISYRKEKNGGFIFNPHLYNEKWTNNIEYNILQLLNGTKSVSDIVDIISHEFKIDNNCSKNMVHDCIIDLNNYYAINWRNKPIYETSKQNLDETLHRKIEFNDYYSAPLSVLWDLTYRCNMKCKHCLNDDSYSINEIGINDVKHILTELKKEKVFSINFSGGEPLLRKDLLDILEIASEMNFGIRLSTNGLLLDNDFLTKLKNLDVYCIQISLDGLEDTHNEFRGVKGGYKKAVESLRLCSENGFYTTMSTMIIKQNLHEISDLIKIAVSLGVSSFKLNSFMPVGRGRKSSQQLHVSKDELRDLCKELSSHSKKYGGLINLQLNPLFPWLLENNYSKPLIRGINSETRIRCSAGQTNLVISPDGTVYSCPYLTQFPLGNILEKPLRAIWNDNSSILGRFRNLYQSQLEGKCKECPCVPKHCNGGCRAAAFLTDCNFYSEDPFCWKCC